MTVIIAEKESMAAKIAGALDCVPQGWENHFQLHL